MGHENIPQLSLSGSTDLKSAHARCFAWIQAAVCILSIGVCVLQLNQWSKSHITRIISSKWQRKDKIRKGPKSLSVLFTHILLFG